MNPDISVIIVSWNAKKYLYKCLSSIYKTAGDLSIEIIVVDNYSTDGSCDMVKHSFPQATLIEMEENLGFAKANNRGIERALGKYIFFINSDVIVLGECFQKLYGFLENNPDIGICGPQILFPNNELQRSVMNEPTLWNTFCAAFLLDKLDKKNVFFKSFEPNLSIHNRTHEVDIINGCFWATRKKALQDVIGLDERFFMYGEDIDFCIRFKKAGWKVFYFTETSSVHFGGASSDNAPLKYYLEMHRANIQFWEKHHSPYTTLIYRLLLIIHQSVRLVIRYPKLLVSKNDSNLQYKVKRSIACLLFLSGLKIESK
jgi:GT2 family glycosyltransferase